MQAFLVIYLVVMGPTGPMQSAIRLPWVTLEACEEYLKHPAPYAHKPGLQILGSMCVRAETPT